MSARLPHLAAQSVFACFHNLLLVCVLPVYSTDSKPIPCNVSHNGSGNNQLEKSTATAKYAMYGRDMLTTCMANILCDCKQPERISSKLYYLNLCSHGTGKILEISQSQYFMHPFPVDTAFFCLGSPRLGPFAASIGETIAPAAVDKSGDYGKYARCR